jgi:hypothetical protein
MQMLQPVHTWWWSWLEVDTEVQKLQLAQDEKHCLKLAREEES